MRIVAGRHRGRRLTAPKGVQVRPTAERAREMVFDVLAHCGLGPGGASPIIGGRVLDAFCGAGALALEALSRGGEAAVLIDQDKQALDCARANARSIGEDGHCRFLLADALRPPSPAAGDAAGLFFLDPPYGQALLQTALPALAEAGWLAPGAIGVVELGGREDFIAPAGFSAWREKRAGAGRFFFLAYQA